MDAVSGMQSDAVRNAVDAVMQSDAVARTSKARSTPHRPDCPCRPCVGKRRKTAGLAAEPASAAPGDALDRWAASQANVEPVAATPAATLGAEIPLDPVAPTTASAGDRVAPLVQDEPKAEAEPVLDDEFDRKRFSPHMYAVIKGRIPGHKPEADPAGCPWCERDSGGFIAATATMKASRTAMDTRPDTGQGHLQVPDPDGAYPHERFAGTPGGAGPFDHARRSRFQRLMDHGA